MTPPAPAHCPHCGSPLASAFLGRTCARCLLTSMTTGAAILAEPPDEKRRDQALPPLTPAPRTRPEGPGVGERFGDYELVDVLGRGGMAVVYLARQISLDRLVALKTIAARLVADASSQERFRREARAVAALDHPGIVSVYDAGVLGGTLFYTMEFVEGQDLAHFLRAERLPARRAADLVRRVAEAVGYAHTRGIVHRDLKPSNVLLDAAGQPRVVDFGLAYEVGDAAGRLTLTGDLLGTPPYMAPEALTGGAGRAVPPTDVYALGAMLFEMLTGRTPFIGDSPSEILDTALREPPPSLRLFNPTVPRDLEVICLKCLEKPPGSRYADGSELAADLGRFGRGEAILARPVSAPVRAWRWGRRRPALATLVVALLLGTVGATWAALTINGARRRAVSAEVRAQEELWRANLAHAQAARRTTQAGARQEALDAVAAAAAFRPSLELRNEAIAALCLDDAEPRRTWPLPLPATTSVAFDPALESYFAEAAPGELVRRACDDDRELGRLAVPGLPVIGIPVVSPDGRHLAARYADSKVRVWDLATGRLDFTLPGRPSPMAASTVRQGYDLAFRPDGGQLAVGRAEGGCTLHAVPGGEEQGRADGEFRPILLRYSPDGTRLALAVRQRAQVQILDARTLAVQRTAALPSVPVCAAWSPAGDRLAVGTRASRIHFLLPETGEIADSIPAYENGAVGQIAFHPTRPIIIGNGSDEAVRFWDTGSGRLLMRLDSVSNQPVLTFDPTGRRLGSCNDYTNRASLIRVRPSPIYQSVPPPQPVRATIAAGALAVSRDGRWTASCTQGTVQLRDARNGQTLRLLPSADPNDVLTAQFAPDGGFLFVNGTLSGLCRMALTVTADGQPVLGGREAVDAEPDYVINDVAPDGRLALVSVEGQTIKLVDPARPQARSRWQVSKVANVCFGPDGRQLLSVAGEKVPGEAAVKVWDLTAEAPRLTASFGDDPGGRVQHGRAGGWVVVTGEKRTELWRAGSWERGPALPAELQGETHHARLSPDGTTLVIEKNGKLHVLDTATGQVLAVCEGGSPAGICVNEEFSPDGQRLTLLWQYGVVHVWDLATMHRELASTGLDWTAGR